MSLICIMPSKADAYQIAKTHSWKSSISANISTDGSISVSETRIVDITKFIQKAKTPQQPALSEAEKAAKLSSLTWNFYNLPEESNIVLGNAKAAILSNEDVVLGNWKNFSIEQFLSKWNRETVPDTNVYTYDTKDKQMCMFFDLISPDEYTNSKCSEIVSSYIGSQDINTWNTTKAIINLNYTIQRAGVIYKDVADFKWAYCPDSFYMDSYNVDLSLKIPVGKASIANPLGKVTSIEQNNTLTERNIYAWGHGSSNGVVDLNPNGTITLNNDIVPANSNAEIRVVFPSAWLTNLDLGSDISKQNQTKLTSILKEESVWKDNRTNSVNKLLISIAAICCCIVVLIIVLLIYLSYKKRFTIKTIDKEKLNSLNPCFLVRLKNWNHEFAQDLVVSILHLNQRKIIQIKRLPSSDFIIKLKNSNYAKDPYSSKSLDMTDKRTINFLFKEIAFKNDFIRLSDIENYAHSRPFEFMSKYLSWQSLLTDEINKFTNFKSNYDKIRHLLFGISIFCLCVSVAVGIFFFDWLTFAALLLTSIVVAYLANSMRNKLYYVDEDNSRKNIIDIDISFSRYTKTVDSFRVCAIKKIKQNILDAQDSISKFNWDKTQNI